MKANQLRIGNWVLLTKNHFDSVEDKNYQLSGFDIYKAEESDCFDIKPIPLTEEWLSKFELEHVETRGRWIKDKFVIWKQRYLDPLSIFEQNKFYLQVVDFQGDIFTLHLEIKYVHQLQNLYFAHTGEELPLKPHTDDCK